MEDFDFVAHTQQSSVIIRKNGDFEDAGKGSHVQHIIISFITAFDNSFFNHDRYLCGTSLELS